MDSFVIPKEDDFYVILGCYENSTNEQISTEYRLKMLKYHPDKASDISLNDETYHNIQRAKEVLLDEQMRAKYDNWRQSGILVSWDQWLALQEKTHLSMHWAPKVQPQPALQDGRMETQDKLSLGGNDVTPPTSSMDQLNDLESQKHLSEFRTHYSSSKSKKSLSKFRNYQD